MPNMIYDSQTGIKGINDILHTECPVSLIESVKMVIVRDIGADLILVITAPGREPVEIFSKHIDYVITISIIIYIILTLMEEVLKLTLCIGRNPAERYFGIPVNPITQFSINSIPVAIPITIEITVIKICRHIIICCISNLPIHSPDRDYLVITTEDNIFQGGIGLSVCLIGIDDKISYLFLIIDTVVILINIFHREETCCNSPVLLPGDILTENCFFRGTGNDHHLIGVV